MSALSLLSYRYLGSCWLLFFFFFQAEDGIRDLTVTGVQTCALPICLASSSSSTSSRATCSRRGSCGARCTHRRRSPSACSSCSALCSASRGSSSRRSEEHTSELQSQSNLVCRLLLEKKKIYTYSSHS